MKKILLGLLVGLGIAGGTYYYVAQKAEAPQAPVKQVIPPGEHGTIAEPVPVTENLIKLDNNPLSGMVGATIPTAVARFETSLASKITNSATSMTLSSDPLYTKIGTHLTGPVCFTIDEGTTVVEDVCGTASGTAITSLTRGISPLTGTSTVSALRFEHRRGASVKITDSPQIIVNSRILNGDETLPNPIRYDLSISTTTISSNSGNLASVGYVNTVSLQGGPTATTTLAGVVQIGTASQLQSGTSMTGAYTLVPGFSLFSPTSTATTLIPVTGTNGKLSQGFLDLTQPFTFTATTTFSGPIVGINQTKFGGDGSDGALNIISGTTTISCGLSNFCIKNYTSISITGTGSLAFSAPSSTGTTIILKSQGNVTLTSSALPNISTMGMGATSSVTALGILDEAAHAGQCAATAGTQYTNRYFYPYWSTKIYSKGIYLTPGSGGGNGDGAGNCAGSGAGSLYGAGAVGKAGGDYSGAGTAATAKMTGGGGAQVNNTNTSGVLGGMGGGALYMEVGGALNFTGTIYSKGSPGQDGGKGSGGGGSGGMVLILYNTLTASSGTITDSGGKGGDVGGSVGGAAGPSSGGLILKNTEF